MGGHVKGALHCDHPKVVEDLLFGDATSGVDEPADSTASNGTAAKNGSVSDSSFLSTAMASAASQAPGLLDHPRAAAHQLQLGNLATKCGRPSTGGPLVTSTTVEHGLAGAGSRSVATATDGHRGHGLGVMETSKHEQLGLGREGYVRMGSQLLLITPALRKEVQSAQIHVFHCEYSKNRGPRMLHHVRNRDRALHQVDYPKLQFKEMYLLH